jgi:hypothetical protein
MTSQLPGSPVVGGNGGVLVYARICALVREVPSVRLPWALRHLDIHDVELLSSASVNSSTRWVNKPAGEFAVTARSKTVDTLVQKLQRSTLKLDTVQDLAAYLNFDSQHEYRGDPAHLEWRRGEQTHSAPVAMPNNSFAIRSAAVSNLLRAA